MGQSEHLNLSGILPPVAAHPLAPEMGIFSPKEKPSTGGFRGEGTSLTLALVLFMPRSDKQQVMTGRETGQEE